MLEELIRELGVNYKNEDRYVLLEIIDDMSNIASNISNRQSTDLKLKPYIKYAVKSAYLIRGDEGKKSSSEGSISCTYEDIVEKLRNDIIKNGIRRMI